jgi:hypothetical protein
MAGRDDNERGFGPPRARGERAMQRNERVATNEPVSAPHRKNPECDVRDIDRLLADANATGRGTALFCPPLADAPDETSQEEIIMGETKATGLAQLYASLHHLRVELEAMAMEARGNAVVDPGPESWDAFAEELDVLRAKLDPLCEEARKGGAHSNQDNFNAAVFDSETFKVCLDLITELNASPDEEFETIPFTVEVPMGHVMMAAMLEATRPDPETGVLSWSNAPVRMLCKDDWAGLTELAEPTITFLVNLALQNEERTLNSGQHAVFYPDSGTAYRGYWLTGNWSWNTKDDEIPF